MRVLGAVANFLFLRATGWLPVLRTHKDARLRVRQQNDCARLSPCQCNADPTATTRVDMQQEFLWAAIALLAAAALAWWFLRRAQGVDPRIEHEFNKVFMTTFEGRKRGFDPTVD